MLNELQKVTQIPRLVSLIPSFMLYLQGVEPAFFFPPKSKSTQATVPENFQCMFVPCDF